MLFEALEVPQVTPICRPWCAVPCPLVSMVAVVPPKARAGYTVPEGTPRTMKPCPLPVPRVAPGGAVQMAKSNCPNQLRFVVEVMVVKAAGCAPSETFVPMVVESPHRGVNKMVGVAVFE